MVDIICSYFVNRSLQTFLMIGELKGKSVCPLSSTAALRHHHALIFVLENDMTIFVVQN